ncbi:MAG TPA: type III pantothenate kinase [Candidatus Competibacteraceae bacterium]|nr:type III pantothenate kinase [Candidatus Competibacteraceae bacterium]
MLLVDIGNTRLKWALWVEQGIVRRGAAAHAGCPAQALLAAQWHDLPTPQRVAVASVADSTLAQAVVAWSRRRWGCETLLARSRAEGYGVRNAYTDPGRLGVDRWLAMVGAHALGVGDCCIIDCGTAITLDALTSDGRHLGGVILPGAALMRVALYCNTRRIPKELNGQITVLGTSTRDCVWGGTAYAAAAAIDRISEDMAANLDSDMQRLLTGGDAEAMLPYLRHAYRLEPDLVFHGLYRIAQST